MYKIRNNLTKLLILYIDLKIRLICKFILRLFLGILTPLSEFKKIIMYRPTNITKGILPIHGPIIHVFGSSVKF